MFDRRRHSLEPADGPQADVQIEDLSKRDVEASNSTADRSCQRTLDPDQILREGIESILRKPDLLAVDVVGLLAGIYFVPCDLAAATVGPLNCRIEDANRGTPDVRT